MSVQQLLSEVGAGLRPYKVCSFNLKQQGTNDPVAIEYENTLGGPIVWTRVDALNFEGRLDGAFAQEPFIQPRDIVLNTGYQLSCYRIDNDKIGISITVDGVLYTGVDFEVRIYGE